MANHEVVGDQTWKEYRGSELLEKIPNFAPDVETSLHEVIEDPSHETTLARFVTTSVYLARYPWCDERPGGPGGDLSGVAASFRGALARYAVSGAPASIPIEETWSLYQARALVEGWRTRLHESAHLTVQSGRYLDHFALKLGWSDIDVPQLPQAELVPHVVGALDQYADRRYHLDNPDPW